MGEVKSLFGIFKDDEVIESSEVFASPLSSSVSNFLLSRDPWNLNNALDKHVSAIGLTRESIFQALEAANHDVGLANANIMASLRISPSDRETKGLGDVENKS